MNTAGLNGSKAAGESDDSVFERGIQMGLKCWRNLALKADRGGVVGGHIEFGLDLAAWLIERRKDHPQRLGEGSRRVLVILRQSGQSTIPGRAGNAASTTPPDPQDSRQQGQQSKADRNRRGRCCPSMGSAR